MFDSLSKSIACILSDIETSLCLPIILIIIISFGQLIYGHFSNIGSTVCQAIKDRPQTVQGILKNVVRNDTNNSFLKKIKDMLMRLIFGDSTDSTRSCTPQDGNSCHSRYVKEKRPKCETNEWEYFDCDYE
ncbi:uncharacterized protein [Prorops nasuta]|uniref:uncharacterized protein n=1 Tax=Prorops nasuta TaxID=863751 RepID=UPI0034CE9EC7